MFTVDCFKDVDECAERPCDTGELCMNTPGSYKCQCKNGFKLDSVMNVCTGNIIYNINFYVYLLILKNNFIFGTKYILKPETFRIYFMNTSVS